MNPTHYLLNEKIDLFYEMSQASYGATKEECQSKFSKGALAKYQFKVLDREVIDGYPLVLIDFVDSVGRKHLAIAAKGLGGQENNLTWDNFEQAVGAGCYHIGNRIPPLKQAVVSLMDFFHWQCPDVFPKPCVDSFELRLKGTITKWEHQTGRKINSTVGHSGGCLPATLGHKYLLDLNRPVTSVTFNGQLPSVLPRMWNFSTDDDCVTTRFSTGTIFLGNPAYTLGEGGHSIDDFKKHGNRILREVIEDEIGYKLHFPKEEAVHLSEKLEGEPEVSPDTIVEARQFVDNVKQLQAKEERKLKRQEMALDAAKVLEAGLGGIEQLQRQQTANMTNENAQQTRHASWEKEQQHQERQREGSISMQQYRMISQNISIARWTNDQISSNIDSLDFHVKMLEGKIENWKGIQDQLRRKNTKALRSRKNLLEREIREEKQTASSILRGFSVICDVGAVAVSTFRSHPGAGLDAVGMMVNPETAFAETGLRVAGRMAGAGASFLDHGAAKDSFAAQQQVSRLEGLYAQNQTKLSEADQRRLHHEQSLLETLRRVATSDTVPPWDRRKFLEKRIALWDRKLRELKNPKNEEKLQRLRDGLQKSKSQEPGKEKDFQATLLRIRASGLRRDQDFLNWYEMRQELRRSKKSDEELLDKDQKHAEIEDRGWCVADFWRNAWAPSDKEARGFADALHKEVERYFDATEKERHSIHLTLSSFETLAAVMGYGSLQHLARGTQNLYTIGDMARYAESTAFPNIQRARRESGSAIQNLGGIPKLLTGYLVPMLKVAIAGAELYHLSKELSHLVSGAPPVPTKGEIRTQQLEHLSNQLGQLQDSLANIASAMDRQHENTQQVLGICLKKIQKLNTDIEAQLGKGFDKARKHRIKKDFEIRTEKLKEETNRINIKLENFQAKTPTSENLEVFVAKLTSWIKFICLDTQTGMNRPIRGGDIKAPDFLPLTYKHAGNFTALFGSLTQETYTPFPNLNHYHALAEGYLCAAEAASKVEHITPKTRENLELLRSSLIEMGDDLSKFLKYFDSACIKAAESQSSLLQIIKAHQTAVQKMEKENIASLRQKVLALKDGVLQHHAGEARFGLTNLFTNHPIPQISLPPLDEVLKQANEKYPRVRQAVGDVGPLIPVGLWFSIAAPPIGLSALGLAGLRIISSPWDDIDTPITRRYRLIKNRVQESASQLGSARTDNVTCTSSHKVDFSLYISTLNRVHDAFVDSVFYHNHEIYKNTLQDHSFRLIKLNYCQYSVVVGTREEEYRTGEYDRHTGEEGVEYRTVNVYEDRYHVTIGPTTPSLLSQDDLNLIPKGRIMKGYKDLLEHYLDAVGNNTATGKFDQNFLDNSLLIRSSNTDFVPLAFPKKLFRQVEAEYDKCNLAAKGYFLEPVYTFIRKSDRYELAIEFRVDRHTHSSFVVATFDFQSFKAFRAPIKTDTDGITQESADENEFLITAMYGSSFHDQVGFPGKRTAVLKNGSLLAPADEKFCGIYQMIERQLSRDDASVRVINFDSASYDGNDRSDALLGEKSKMDRSSLSLLKREDVSAAYRKYSENYSILKGMYALLANIDLKEIDSTLKAAGLKLIPNRDLEGVYHQMALTPHLSNQNLESVEANLIDLRPLETPSDEITSLNEVLKRLIKSDIDPMSQSASALVRKSEA